MCDTHVAHIPDVVYDNIIYDNIFKKSQHLIKMPFVYKLPNNSIVKFLILNVFYFFLINSNELF